MLLAPRPLRHSASPFLKISSPSCSFRCHTTEWKLPITWHWSFSTATGASADKPRRASEKSKPMLKVSKRSSNKLEDLSKIHAANTAQVKSRSSTSIAERVHSQHATERSHTSSHKDASLQITKTSKISDIELPRSPPKISTTRPPPPSVNMYLKGDKLLDALLQHQRHILYDAPPQQSIVVASVLMTSWSLSWAYTMWWLGNTLPAGVGALDKLSIGMMNFLAGTFIGASYWCYLPTKHIVQSLRIVPKSENSPTPHIEAWVRSSLFRPQKATKYLISADTFSVQDRWTPDMLMSTKAELVKLRAKRSRDLDEFAASQGTIFRLIHNFTQAVKIVMKYFALIAFNDSYVNVKSGIKTVGRLDIRGLSVKNAQILDRLSNRSIY